MIFFSERPGTPFILFGELHWLLLLGTFFAAALMYCYRKKLRQFRYKQQLRYLFAAVLFLNMAVYYIGLGFAGDYDVKRHLPLELCFVTGYLLMYILVTGNRNLYRIVYFFTIVGPLPAMIWPNLSGTFDRYVFYQFIISHHIMLLISLYCMIVLEYRVQRHDIFRAFLCGNGFFVLISIINAIWGTNFVMEQKLPDHILRLYPFLVHFNIPFFWLELCGCVFLFVALVISIVLQREKELLPDYAQLRRKAGDL